MACLVMSLCKNRSRELRFQRHVCFKEDLAEADGICASAGKPPKVQGQAKKKSKGIGKGGTIVTKQEPPGDAV